MHCLIPNINELQATLDTFCNICGADEIVLFEKTTFLVIANSATIRHPDEHRFEKISSIIKLFNLCTRSDKEKTTPKYNRLVDYFCNRKEGYSKQMEIKGSTFTAFFDSLTKNTSVLLVISDSSISKLFIYTL